MSERKPLFRVVRGAPSAEELAALVGLIVSRSRPTAVTAPPAAPAWTRASRPGMVSSAGLPVRPAVDAWRMSGLPR